MSKDTGGTLTLDISLDGAAFDESECAEVARILRALARLVDEVPKLDYIHDRRLMDINGNAVGIVQVNPS